MRLFPITYYSSKKAWREYFHDWLHKGILDSLYLQTQKQQDEILDSSRVLISLSNTSNKNIKNSSTR